MYYEQDLITFTSWLSKNYSKNMSIFIPEKSDVLPDLKDFDIPMVYNWSKDYCYEAGAGYWLDTQQKFFLADTRDRVYKLNKPILFYISFLKKSNIKAPTVSVTNYFINNLKETTEYKYYAFTLINLYFKWLDYLKIYKFVKYMGRAFTGGYVKDAFGNKCCLCSEVMPEVNASSEFYNGNNYFQVHHIVPLRDGGKDDIDNCLLLCPNCHGKIHLGSFSFTKEMLIEISKTCREHIKSDIIKDDDNLDTDYND